MVPDSEPQRQYRLIEARRKRTPAQIALFIAGFTQSDFARFHGCSIDWAHKVLRRDVPAPARFRRDLSRLLGVPEADLFPGGKR